MADETLTDTETLGAVGDEQSAATDELSVLKQRARLMGVTFSNNIGIDALRSKIEAKLAEEEAEQETIEQSPELTDPAAEPSLRKLSHREQMMADAMKLVRVRITNLDPKKKDLPGEIFTVANNIIGTVSKYIPYGEVTEDGYHIPNVLYENLKERKFLNIRTIKKRINGMDQVRVEQSWATEFAFEVLPQLTPEELQKLAAAQAAAGGL